MKPLGMLVEQDYQDLEVWYPILRLREAGHKVLVVGTGTSEIYKGKFGYPIKVDTTADRVAAKEVDGLVIPGGWAPDYLRRSRAVLDLVRDCHQQGKVVAAICHAGWVLASAGILKGRTVTCFAAIKDDMEAAGATWVDKEVQVDGNLVTARKPDDLPAFMREVLRLLEGRG